MSLLSDVRLLGAGLLLIVAGGLMGVLLRGRGSEDSGDVAYRVLLVPGCLLAALPALGALAGLPVREFRFGAALPGGEWVFGLDALSAVFVLAVLLVGGASAWYGVGYLRGEHGRRPVAASHLAVAVLIAALALVVAARSVLPFLVAWETMAVVAYALVVFEHKRAPTRRAGLLYLVATHTGTLALFALFAAWSSGAPELTFAALAARSELLPAGGALVLLLALLGFGVKAGLVPLHFWLPEAHAAAPSHVSALMSGVVIKMGIYGLMRVQLMLGAPPAWWGWLLLVLGLASGVLGVVWALAQHDLKRLLAFHSVENIGIILLGVGAGALGMSYGHREIAVLGFAGAALHTLNHAIFKSLLFLGAGVIQHATGTREIDRLGGLWRFMPASATAFLVGAAAIVGLPPLNGFLSEWLVLRSLLRAGLEHDAARVAILAAAGLGLIGALALACFAKVAGIIFLGTPRDPDVAAAHEPALELRRPLFLLAAACVLIGILPFIFVPPVLRAGALVASGAFAEFGGFTAGSAPGDVALVIRDPSTAVVSWFMFGAALLLVLAWLLRERLLPAAAAERTETWGCGYHLPTARMQYTASSFAAPLLCVFAGVSGSEVERTSHSLHTHAVDPVLARAVAPAWRTVRRVAGRVRTIQRGRLSLYLVYIAITVVVLLLYLLAWGRVP